MNRMIKFGFILTIIVCVFFVQLITPVFAHPASQENILSKSYCDAKADSLSSKVLAHEFGHAIGLKDLTNAQNINKLMYGYSNGTATAPASADIWGAKVITGVHTTHTWGYNLIAGVLGNSHQKYCTACNGLTSYVQRCTYGTDNRCTVCGYGRQTVAP